jgi:thymidylate synthase (FAD)
MKVITDSKVTVVGQTAFLEHPEYGIPADGTDAERLGAFAAKGCYDSYGVGGRPCIENQKQIIEHLHGSVLEHSYVSLFIEGVTRALTLELNRHRLFNISQRSTRYTKEEDSAIVLEPYYADIWRRYRLEWDTNTDWITVPENYILTKEENPEAWMLIRFLDQCKSAILEYKTQVEMLVALNPNKLTGFDLRKWARGKARNILPHALETRGTWTMNHRAWRWFIEARSSRHAEPELRRLAEKVLVPLIAIAPTYYDDFHLNGIIDNIPEYVPTHHKV